MQDTEVRWEAAARTIREKSRAGQLASAEDILDESVMPAGGKLREGGQGDALNQGDGLSQGDALNQGDALEDLHEMIVEKSQDIRVILSRAGSRYYYSALFMTEAYAGILLKKGEDPLGLIADLVRENAARYPRPTSIDVFRSSPFEMSQEEIGACLQNMTEKEDYRDIKQLSTSAGTVYLYSTLHLDPAHASMLAEWIDVGQFENP